MFIGTHIQRYVVKSDNDGKFVIVIDHNNDKDSFTVTVVNDINKSEVFRRDFDTLEQADNYIGDNFLTEQSNPVKTVTTYYTDRVIATKHTKICGDLPATSVITRSTDVWTLTDDPMKISYSVDVYVLGTSYKIHDSYYCDTFKDALAVFNDYEDC